MPVGWNIRWYTDTAVVIDDITYKLKQPEVKIIDNAQWPFCAGCAPNVPPRIHNGRYAVDSFTVGLQAPLSLTQVNVALPDPIGNFTAIESLSSSATAPYTLRWRFVPAAEGVYRFMVTEHELPDPLVKSIEADEFMQPFVRRILVCASRIYSPMLLRS